MEDQGVDPNLRDGDGATPLHFAASRGHLTAVRWLLSHGARLSLDKYGKSPINDAAENQQVECLNVLVQHGTAPEQASSGSSNYEGSVYRTKVGGTAQPKKYSSTNNSNNYYNTKQNLLNNNNNNHMPSQHSMHHHQAPHPGQPQQHHQLPLPPPPKIKIPKSPESTSNSCSSDTEPFYLHPPSLKGGTSLNGGVGGIKGPIVKDGLIYGTGSQSSTVRGGSARQSSASPVDYGVSGSTVAGSVGVGVPNDGLYVNPMRQGSLTPPSPGGSISGESFYLHDPQEVIYNRVKDLFDSDSSSVNNNYSSNKIASTAQKDGSGASHKNTNALTGGLIINILIDEFK